MNVGYLLLALPFLIWVVTLGHVIKTRGLAKSGVSQTLWILFIFLMPEIGILFYWLTEAPIRRRGPPPAFAG